MNYSVILGLVLVLALYNTAAKPAITALVGLAVLALLLTHYQTISAEFSKIRNGG